MKNLLYLVLFGFVMTTLVSCGQNEGKKALAEMEKLVVIAEKEKDQLTSDEWEELIISFEKNEKIANESAKTDKLGVADRKQLIELTTRWASAARNTIVDEIFSKMSEELFSNGTSTDSSKN